MSLSINVNCFSKCVARLLINVIQYITMFINKIGSKRCASKSARKRQLFISYALKKAI